MTTMRFTVSDLLWLTVVVALALTLWIQHVGYAWRSADDANRLGVVRRHAMALRDSLANAEQNEAVYLGRLADVKELEGDVIEVDWTLADRMIP